MMTIDQLSKLLSSRSRFVIDAVAKDSQPFAGRGVINVSQPDDQTIIFEEQGVWISPPLAQVTFRNIYRWTLNRERQTCGLAHLRNGWDDPLHIVDFVAVGDDTWECIAPHPCREDIYAARLNYSEDTLKLWWKVEGPAKDEEIRYTYA